VPVRSENIENIGSINDFQTIFPIQKKTCHCSQLKTFSLNIFHKVSSRNEKICWMNNVRMRLEKPLVWTIQMRMGGKALKRAKPNQPEVPGSAEDRNKLPQEKLDKTLW